MEKKDIEKVMKERWKNEYLNEISEKEKEKAQKVFFY